MLRRRIARRALLALAVAALATARSGGAAGAPLPDPPASAGSRAPRLAAGTRGEALLAWLEPDSAGPPGAWRLRFARLAAAVWSAARTVAAGDGMLANGADGPAIAQGGDGALVATWSVALAGGGEASAVEVARSIDGGETWTRLGRLHDDAAAAEHGFVSLVAERDGVRAFWLDGRETPRGGATALRSAVVRETVGLAEVLDARVCDCCQTGAALGMNGPLVVYRDRGEQEVREPSVVRWLAPSWSAPVPVVAGGWRIAGCPVNGPALAARGAFTAVAWYSAADERPRVEVALSHDAGKSFAPPVVLDGDRPLGRVSAAIGADGAVRVVWMARAGEGATVRWARVASDGRADAVVELGAAAASRATGYPQVVAWGERLLAVWVDPGKGGQGGRLRVAELAAQARPEASPPGGTGAGDSSARWRRP
ncbi:MAG: hypothetical protein U0X73_10760 [Thermoanaerobaculia bacterium]